MVYMKRTKEITVILLSLILWLGMIPVVQVSATAPDQSEGAGTAENTGDSADNSLSSLSLSAGTLSPGFQYNVTDYTASVGADVSSVEVNAKTSNEFATIESIAGNTELKAGQNTISIVVRAQNGVKATYKIVVTRGGADAPEAGEEPKEQEEGTQDNSQEPQENGSISMDGHPFNLSVSVPEEVIPQDFTKTSVECQGQQVEGLQFEKGELTLVYLTTPSQDVKNTLAVYDAASKTFYPFRKIDQGGSNYLILLEPPAESGLPSEYTKDSKSVGEYGKITMFRQADSVPQAGDGVGGLQGAEDKEKDEKDDGFFLVYAASSFGNIGWYQYDSAESTFQRVMSVENASSVTTMGEDSEEPSMEMQALQNAYKDLEEKFSKKKASSTKVTSVLIFVIVVLVIVIVNLVLRIRKEDEDFDSWSEPQSGKRQKSGENMNKKELESRRKNRMENISIKELELGKNSRREENQNHESKPQRTNYQAQKLDTETQIKNRKVQEGQPDAVVQKPMLADELQKILRGEQASQRKGVSQETKMMHKSESQNSQERIQKENVQNPGQRMEQEKRTPQNTSVKEPDDYFEVIDLEDL